jgi:hypothetical protein
MYKFFTTVILLGITSLTLAQDDGRHPSQAGKILKGKLKKEICSDSGGVFAIDYGCKPMALGNSRDCSVEFQYTDRSKFAVLSTGALKETNDHRKIDFHANLSKGAYHFSGTEQGSVTDFMIKFDKDTSSEIRLLKDKKGRYTIPKFNIYTKHVIKKDKNGKTLRTFHQYSCTDLK